MIIDWVVDDRQVGSTGLGAPWRVLVQRPADPLDARGLPWIWLLHGRNGSGDEMRPLLAAAASAMRAGELPPALLVVPEAPAGHSTSWWLDSDHEPTGDAAHEVAGGVLLETSLLDEVRPTLEDLYGKPDGPGSRVIGGISMGGGAALRWLVVRPDLFGAAVLLSPGVFADLPVTGSADRRRDVVDVEASIFDTDRYERLMHYPTLLATVEAGRPSSRIVVLVGDGEPVREGPGGRHDLDLEAARLHAMLKTHPAYEPSLRVVDGGHDWPVWERGIVTALQVLAGQEQDD